MEISRSINQALIQSSISLDRIPWIAEDLNKFVGCLGAVSHAPDACQMLAYSGSSEEWPDTVAWVLGVSDFSAAFLWTWSAAERRIVEVGAMINSSELELLPLPVSAGSLSWGIRGTDSSERGKALKNSQSGEETWRHDGRTNLRREESATLSIGMGCGNGASLPGVFSCCGWISFNRDRRGLILST